MRRIATTSLFAAIVVAAVAHAQSQTGPMFDVASVKPNNGGSGSASIDDNPGSYSAINMPLRRLIAYAYRMHPVLDRERIVGPSWIDTARFDITARTPPDTPVAQMPDMLRALLADRFKLAAHTDRREDLVYGLVRARADGQLGPQLTVSSLDCSKPGLSGSTGFGVPSSVTQAVEKPQCGMVSIVDGNGGVMRGGGRSISELAKNLTGQVNRTVIDRTGLSEAYDFILRWTPENFQNVVASGGPSRDGTPIVTALQEQLGLQLDSQRGPVEFLVVDRIERPSPD